MYDESFRVMFIYDKDRNPVGCLVFMGDGKYINPKFKTRVCVSKHFESEVFIHMNKSYITLFDFLEKLDSNAITERNLIERIYEKTDFSADASIAYTYKYDRLSGQVFRNVVKKNDMIDFEELKGEIV